MTDPNVLFKSQMAEARRAQILDAAVTVFAEKGFHRATTKEVAKVAGVSPGTIYNYFDSKEDLLVGIVTRLAEQQRPDEVFAQALRSDARDSFVVMYRLRQELIQQYGAMLQVVLSEVLINREFGERYYREIVAPFLELTEQYIQAQIERGQIRPVNAAWAARILFAINLGLTLGLVVGDPLFLSELENPSSLAEILADLVFDGLGPREETQE
jgi:TetR/AcrR family fatty acid metabolism transcriptional regulator